MTYIARQRLKVGGKYHFAGDRLELTEEQLAELPANAVEQVADEDVADEDVAPKTSDGLELAPEAREALEAMTTAVDALPENAFKKDGGIRSDALRDLNATLGFEVTAEDVAALKAGSETPEGSE